MPSVTSKAAPGAVPPATETPVSAPLSSAQDPDIMTSHDFDITMADITFSFENTMKMDDRGEGAVTLPSCTASVSIPEELDKAIEDELKASSGTISDTDMSTYDLLPRPIGTHETLSTQVTIPSPLIPIRTQDTHNRTLRATRVLKVPDTASAAVAAATGSESKKQISANTAVIRKWISQRQVVTTVPTTFPIGPKGQSAWILCVRWN